MVNVNDAPVITPVADRTLDEGALLQVQMQVTDPDSSNFSWNLVNPPLGATIDDGGMLRWTPADGAASATLTVRVSDNGSPALAGETSFVVSVRNVAPVLTLNGAASGTGGTPYTLAYSVAEPGADTLLGLGVDWGDGSIEDVVGNPGSLTHTYAASDGDYTIRVTPRDEDGSYPALEFAVTMQFNDAPVAVDRLQNLAEDGSIVITLAASDEEGGPLAYGIESGPTHGMLSAIDALTNRVTYTPFADFNGIDSFSFRVVDAEGAFDIGFINLVIDSVNDRPVAQGQSVTVDEDASVTITLGGSDAETAPADLVFAIVSGPAHGTLGALDGVTRQVTYTPGADYFGADSFVFRITDANGASSQATVSIDVNGLNDAPRLAAVTPQQVLAGASFSLQLQATDADGDTLGYAAIDGPAGLTVSSTGLLSWTAPYLDANFSTPVSVQVSDGNGGVAQGGFSLSVDADLLRVQSLTQTQTGYQVRFNHAFDPAMLNLYDAEDPDQPGVRLGAADAVLRNAANKALAGSLVFDVDQMGFTFVRTGGVLCAGAPTLSRGGRADAFVDTHGRRLDGNGDGVAGGDYLGGFVQSAGGAVLSIGELARGPGQVLQPAAVATGMPVRIANAAGATSVSFVLDYDATLLAISAVTSPLPGATVTADLGTPGHLTVSVSGLSGLTNAATDLLRLAASVPESAPYGAKHVLNLSGVMVNAAAARDDDGLHVVAYVGDTSGNADYSTLDVTRLQRVLLRLDSGFGAWPLVDPTVIGNAAGNGTLSSLDTRLLSQKLNGIAQIAIPEIPVTAMPLTFAGADPLVTVATRDALAGGTVVVPVQIDTAANLVSVQLTLTFPATDLQLVNVRQGPLTLDFSSVVQAVQPGRLTLDMSRINALGGGAGSLLELEFKVSATATGTLPIDLQWVALNDTRLTLNPAPRPGADPTDGAVVVRPATGAASTAGTGQSSGTVSPATANWIEDWLSGASAQQKKPAGNWRVFLPRQ